MAEDTPFINSLSERQLQLVQRRALTPRPSYLFAGADRTDTEAAVSGSPVPKQLSADGEAYLILLSAQSKTALIAWIESILLIQNDPLMLQLFAETVDARQAGLQQVLVDVGQPSQSFSANQQSLSPSIFVDDAANLATAMKRGLDVVFTSGNEAIHDRIMDVLTLKSYTERGSGNSAYRQELQSWKAVVSKYL